MKLLIALMLVNPFGLIINNKNAMNDTTIVTHADDKEWIYEKKADGHTYKRLYNHTTKKWETDWILVW